MNTANSDGALVDGVEVSPSPMESRRCKHCGETVVGNHSDRLAHRQTCSAAPAANRPSSVLAHRATSSSSSPQKVATISRMSHKEQLDYLASVVCRFCGQAHGPATCMDRLPHGYRERLKCNAADQLTRGRIPFSNRMCVTPDLDGFDRKMDKLVKQLVPQSDATTTPHSSSNHQKWRRCAHCRKRVVAGLMVQHTTHSCIVQQVRRRVLALEMLILGHDQLDTRGETDDASHQMDRQQALELLLSDASPVLSPLPPSVRRHEQIALLVGSIHAVVQVGDLVAPDNDDGEKMSEDNIRRVIPEIRDRVEAWAAALREELDSNLSSVSAILHAPPLLLTNGPASPSMVKKSSDHSSGQKQSKKGKKGFSDEAQRLARQLNKGDIVSMDDHRQQQEFYAKRAACSVSNSSRSPSRCGSAASDHSGGANRAGTRPSSGQATSSTCLPPLVPKHSGEVVHQPPLD